MAKITTEAARLSSQLAKALLLHGEFELRKLNWILSAVILAREERFYDETQVNIYICI